MARNNGRLSVYAAHSIEEGWPIAAAFKVWATDDKPDHIEFMVFPSQFLYLTQASRVWPNQLQISRNSCRPAIG